MKVVIKDICVEIPKGPIGIKCSGGADSSLLLYILMKNTTAPIHVFSGSFKVKNRSVSTVTKSVIDKCIELTGNNQTYQHIIFRDDETQEPINYFAYSYIAKGIINLLYSGLTSTPPDDIIKNFHNNCNEIYQDRNPNILKDPWFRNKTVYKPFINIHKQKIKELYEHLGILESLFPLTRSCESFEIFTGHCKKCWWCEERFWGFNRYE